MKFISYIQKLMIISGLLMAPALYSASPSPAPEKPKKTSGKKKKVMKKKKRTPKPAAAGAAEAKQFAQETAVMPGQEGVGYGQYPTSRQENWYQQSPSYQEFAEQEGRRMRNEGILAIQEKVLAKFDLDVLTKAVLNARTSWDAFLAMLEKTIMTKLEARKEAPADQRKSMDTIINELVSFIVTHFGAQPIGGQGVLLERQRQQDLRYQEEQESFQVTVVGLLVDAEAIDSSMLSSKEQKLLAGDKEALEYLSSHLITPTLDNIRTVNDIRNDLEYLQKRSAKRQAARMQQE